MDASSSSNPQQIQNGETHSEVSEVYDLNCLSYIVSLLRNAYKILAGKPESKGQLGRCRWYINVKIAIKEMEYLPNSATSG
jgi:hypothetical protein